MVEQERQAIRKSINFGFVRLRTTVQQMTGVTRRRLVPSQRMPLRSTVTIFKLSVHRRLLTFNMVCDVFRVSYLDVY